MTTHEMVRGFRRPASLGGPAANIVDSDQVILRWYGTTNFELEFGDKVVLLDNFYDRGPRTSDVGFRAKEVERADLILIGHPHYDHIADTATVAAATGAPVIVSRIGADLLVDQGLAAEQVEAVTGAGTGDLLEFDGFSVRALHGLHMRREGPAVTMIKDLRGEWENDLGPLTAEEEQELETVFSRGSMDPAIFTVGTLCLVIDIGAFRIVFRDSAGPISDEERAWFTENPGCDLGIVAYTGRPVARRTVIEMTLPLVSTYQPQWTVPCHHDDLFPHFLPMATEPLRMAVREALPGGDLLQPIYVEPVTIDMRTHSLRTGDH